jgi:hypothetical protein
MELAKWTFLPPELHLRIVEFLWELAVNLSI